MRTIPMFIAAILLNACAPGTDTESSTPNADAKIASNENFAAAAQRYFDANPACFAFGPGGPKSFPADLYISLGFSAHSNAGGLEPKPTLDRTLARGQFSYLKDFVKLGFLTAEIREQPGQSSSQPDYFLHLELTEAGRPHLAPSTAKPGFCYAKVKVLEVTDFMPPKEESRLTVSKVQVVTQLTDLQDWPKATDLTIAFDAAPQTRQMVMVLRIEGWEKFQR
jgi:hypothetical protein